MQENIQIKSLSLYNFGQKLFWMFLFLIACSLAFYVYIIQSTIVHIVDRQTAETEIRSAESRVAELESEITLLGKSVDVSFALSEGYQEISNIDYVSRSPVLTMRDDHGR